MSRSPPCQNHTVCLSLVLFRATKVLTTSHLIMSAAFSLPPHHLCTLAGQILGRACLGAYRGTEMPLESSVLHSGLLQNWPCIKITHQALQFDQSSVHCTLTTSFFDRSVTSFIQTHLYAVIEQLEHTKTS